MPQNKTLTTNKKDKLFPVKLEEQKRKCVLCNMPFEHNIIWNESCCFDHLNDDRKDNSDTNLGLVHRECNLIKRYNIDYKIRAADWKRHLESKISLSLGGREGEKKTPAHPEPDNEELNEGQINLVVNKLAQSQLEELLPENSAEQISYHRVLSNIHYLLIKQTGGRGSEQASRRALDNLTKSEYSPWMSKKLGKGNRIIERRIVSA